MSFIELNSTKDRLQQLHKRLRIVDTELMALAETGNIIDFNIKKENHAIIIAEINKVISEMHGLISGAQSSNSTKSVKGGKKRKKLRTKKYRR